MTAELKSPQQLRLNLRRAPSYTSTEFSVGSSNQDAVTRVQDWRNWHNGSLALIGPEASGKTHLARIWAESVGAHICQGGGIARADVASGPLVLEDVDQGFDGEQLFHWLNRAAQSMSPLLLTGRTLPVAWATHIPDLRSRLNALQVVELSPPDDEVLRNILRAFFKSRSIRPAEDIYPYLMVRMHRSIVAARDLVERLDDAADAMGRPISKALAREILGDDTENLDLFDG